ncbi:MAG: helix-turn-helix domain-containing protein [Deltaproteobacteria bacterium]|jgi:transcriptional regulator with XRE-family HTH domain|nr:helix-turn-helix domain-containing protein [Deltaproteobacteria bacterium]
MNILTTVSDNIQIIKKAMKMRRVALGFTQEQAAKRTGIAAGTLKRFERTGEITLERLLCLMKLYDMDDKIVPKFQDMSWWSLTQIERAETRQKA